MRKRFAVLVLTLIAFPALAADASKPGVFSDYPTATTVDACTDFHEYACAAWESAHPIPSDRPGYGTSSTVFDWNQGVLREILDHASAGTPDSDAASKMIGDYYAGCTDVAAIDRRGIEAIRPELARIAAMKSKRDLPPLLAHLHRITRNLVPTTEDSGALVAAFGIGAISDYADAEMIVAAVDQGGLGLPDRDYYFRADAKSRALRTAYAAVIRKFFALAGESAAQAKRDAASVLAIENDLAKASQTIVTRRDPANLNHPMSFEALQKLTPHFDWNAYNAALHLHAPDHYIVYSPDYIRAFDRILTSHPLAEWKAYLRWNLIHLSVEDLPASFREANYDFFEHQLIGRKAPRPRWKVCTSAVDRDLGEVSGRVYVQRAFPPSSKEKMLRLVHAIEHAFDEEVTSLPWMSDETKTAARAKLNAIVDKIGYPDEWHDYSHVAIDRGAPLANAYAASEFAVDDNLSHIGKPRNRKLWTMTPPTVNAYYSTSDNTINFPAGILQPPFFDPDATDAENFGAVGAVIGHELTHGFDDQGRKFDPAGNLRDWWTKEDAARFEERARCLRDEYSGFIAVDDVHLNGEQTLGENTADNGGIRIALRALHDVLRAEGKEDEVINGLTADQRFFLAYAHVWCGSLSPQLLRLIAQTDVHSPGRFRINGVVQNMPEFRSAFGCKAGAAMAPDPACQVW